MKPLFSICLFLCLGLKAHTQSLDELRLLYRDATASEKAANNFYDHVQHVEQTDKPVMVAYKGAGLMLLARYARLSERGNKVREAAVWIEDAVEREPHNAEIRLIRLSVQEHLPKIVRYNQHIDDDRIFVKSALPGIEDEILRNMITSYFEEFSN